MLDQENTNQKFVACIRMWSKTLIEMLILIVLGFKFKAQCFLFKKR